jgi:hypothetical protein
MKTILYIEKNPSVLYMICSVTELYCKSHFLTIARDNLRACIFAVLMVSGVSNITLSSGMSSFLQFIFSVICSFTVRDF